MDSSTKTKIQNTWNPESSSLTVEADTVKDLVYFLGDSGVDGVSFPKKDLVKALVKAGLTLDEFKAGIPTLKDSLEALPLYTVFGVVGSKARFVKAGDNEFRNLDGTLYVKDSFFFHGYEPGDLQIISNPIN